jgi:hydrogenase-4 membrane subunit HyfE
MLRTLAHWLNEFCVWLDGTPASQVVQTTAWIVPTVQTIHILAIAVVMTSALMIDLRLIGILGRDQPIERMSTRFFPAIWWVVFVLFVTGVIMIVGEPARSLQNPIFQLKMALLIVALIVTYFLQRLSNNKTLADGNAALSARAMAVVSVLLWTGIIFSGRWIAYFA